AEQQKDAAVASNSLPPGAAPESPKNGKTTPKKPKQTIHTVRLFNGRDLTGFYSFFGSTETKKGSGKNNDVDKVFSVRSSTLHVSGEHQGVLETEKEYENYHLTVEFKWGERTWPPREENGRRSGIFLHAQPADGAVSSLWPTSIKCRLQ